MKSETQEHVQDLISQAEWAYMHEDAERMLSIMGQLGGIYSVVVIEWPDNVSYAEWIRYKAFEISEKAGNLLNQRIDPEKLIL